MLGFVVLHYQTTDMTIRCVESILSKTRDSKIVIVDNYSPNHSGEDLKTRYADNHRIVCLLAESNLGFANGNNLGYDYLRRNCNCDFICCINNDTELCSDTFESMIVAEYGQSHFEVMAPLVRLKDNSIQAFNTRICTLDEYKEERIRWQNCETYEQYVEGLDRKTRFMMRFPKSASMIRKYKQYISCPYKQRYENIPLHGCFLVFSKGYIKEFEDAFDSRTFMYREEELLYLRLQKNGMRGVYCPDVSIIHYEDAATNATFKSNTDKYKFLRENQLKSLEVLISDLSTCKRGLK